MTEQGDKWSAREKAVGVHLGLVGFSFVVSLQLLGDLVPPNIEGAGIEAAFFMVLLGHGIAVVVSLLFSKASIKSCVVVFCIAFFCTGDLSVYAIKEWRYHHYQAPYDRFRDFVASPIPNSVSNLHFVAEECITTDLMLRFDIAPKDLDAILTSLGMKRVDSKSLPNPKDFFQYPYYLPIDGDDFQLYQAKDQYGGMLTIKTNEAHTQAIFRTELSSVYSERRWENPPDIEIRIADEALPRMKRQYEAARKNR